VGSRVLGPDCHMGFREQGPVALLLAWGNQACWLALSFTHGSVGDMGPASTGVLFSLAFQGEGR
jgi:hypothetical protein